MDGATINGKKPIVGETTHEYGTRSGSGTSAPKASQVAASGAHDPGTGRKQASEEGKGAAAKPEFQTEPPLAERNKRLAKRMYPSSRGSRFAAGD